MKNAPLIIIVAPNGARKTKADHKNLPISPLELAKEAKACKDAGAAMIHLHVRKPDGSHSIAPEHYEPAIKEIRQKVGNDLIIQVTSEACGIYSPEEQMQMVDTLKPQAVSLAVKEIIPDESYIKKAAEFLKQTHQRKISPQYIIYSAEELERYYNLRERGVIPGDNHFLLFVLGRYSKGQTSSPTDLLPFINTFSKLGLDGHAIWSVCAFGQHEAACMQAAALMGGHVRIGFENNMYLHNGRLAENNAELIRQFAENIKISGRSIASMDQASNMVLL